MNQIERLLNEPNARVLVVMSSTYAARMVAQMVMKIPHGFFHHYDNGSRLYVLPIIEVKDVDQLYGMVFTNIVCDEHIRCLDKALPICESRLMFEDTFAGEYTVERFEWEAL